jgi:hypothetical protein
MAKTVETKAEWEARMAAQEKKTQEALDAVFKVGVRPEKPEPVTPVKTAVPKVQKYKNRTEKVIGMAGDSAEALEKMTDEYKQKNKKKK